LRSLAAVLVAALLAVATPAEAYQQRHLSPERLWSAFLCIHRYEGAWSASTGNGYHGGLQMDANFERSYGREFLTMWGHADQWPPAVQMTVAMGAYQQRGFWPWPNTARRCGLL
jgi:hypothetical protein